MNVSSNPFVSECSTNPCLKKYDVEFYDEAAYWSLL